jgi:cysteine-rich repeat protein
MRQAVLAATCIVGVLTSGAASAAEIALAGGRAARFKNLAGTSNDRALVKFTQDPALFTLEDPRCPAASAIRLRTSAQDSGLISLPCANWDTAGTGFRYDDPSGAAGGVQKINYRSGRLQLKLRGDNYSAVSGPVTFVEARFVVGTTRYCGRFEDIRRNDADKVTAGPPSTACQPTCGDLLVDGGEQCDDGNTANGDCCSSTCQFETGPCSDGSLCTAGDTCSNGACISAPVPPWINELDYDDLTGVLDDRDEFVEIAAPAGFDLGGYKLLAIEGNLNGNTQANGAPCYSDLETGTLTGNPYWTAVIPPGTVVGDDTGTGIGYFVACFTSTSANHESLGQCDAILPAPSTSSNLKNGYLINTNVTDCPDGILFLDPFDTLIDAISYEGQLPNLGLYGGLFQTPSYSAGLDQGYVPGVSLFKTSSTLERAQSGTEWDLSGGCIAATPAEAPRETTLDGAITATATSITVVNAGSPAPLIPAFPNAGTILIESELATYASRSGNVLSGVQRGVNGTAAVGHPNGAPVSLETGCLPNSDSPGATNPGQILSCGPSPCGNGAIDGAAGEQCDPNAVPNGCGAGAVCLPAGGPGECSCEALCGNGVPNPGEQCDPPGSTGVCAAGAPCAYDCTCPPPPACGNGTLNAGEECDPPGSIGACAAGAPCSEDCTCPPAPSCTAVAYTVEESGLDLCTAIFGACPPPVTPPLAPPAQQTTFELCFGQPDAAGRVALSIAPETWFADAAFIPAGATSPIPLTQRFCQAVPATGALFTQATDDSFPAMRCLSGDPGKLLWSCTLNADCDGPMPTTGNGICSTRDLDYTGLTTPAGTSFTSGDGNADPAGALLLSQPLIVQVFFSLDVRCTGTGSDPSCVGCDGVSPAPAGRIGVTQAAAAAPSLLLPLANRWSTGAVQNLVNDPGNFIDGRQVVGGGGIRDATTSGEYEVASANATLDVNTPINFIVQIQFLSRNLWSP